MTPGSLKLNRTRSGGSFRPRGGIDVFLVLLVAGAIGVVVWLAMAFWGATRVHVEATGIDDGRALKPEDAELLDIHIALETSDELFRANLEVDGVPLLEDIEPEADGRSVRIRPAELVESELVEHALAEGEHEIQLSVSRLFLGDSTFTWSYVVDSIAPDLDLPSNLDPVPIADPVAVEGRVEEGVDLQLRGEPVDVDGGRFSVGFDTPPTGALAFTATDEAGNTTTKHVVVPVVYPDSSKAVHVSGAAWRNDELRSGVMHLIDQGLIDTVELDLKDEAGVISYDS